jgi:hypothetical protein
MLPIPVALPVARLVRAWYHRGQREVLSGNSQHALKLLTKQLAKRIVSHTKHLLEGQIEFSDDEKERLQRRVLIPFTELHKTIREDAVVSDYDLCVPEPAEGRFCLALGLHHRQDGGFVFDIEPVAAP